MSEHEPRGIAPLRAPTVVGLGPPAPTRVRPPPPPPPRKSGETATAQGALEGAAGIEPLDPLDLEEQTPSPGLEGLILRPAGRSLRVASQRPAAAHAGGAPSPKPAREWGEVEVGDFSPLATPIALDRAPPTRLEVDPAVGEVRRPTPAQAPTLAPLPEGSVYFCDSCSRYIEPGRVVAMSPSEGRVAVPTCPLCRRFVRVEHSAATRSLHTVLVEAVLWPLQRSNMPTLVGNTLVFWVFSSAWMINPLVGLIALGVLATSAASVIRWTSNGEDHAPPPSEVVSSWGIAGAVVRHMLVFLVGLAPMSAAVALAHSPSQRVLFVVLAASWFCLYVPAGQIVASTRETLLAAVNPIVPVRFAWRVGGSYVVASAMLFGFALAHLVCIWLAMAIAATLVGTGFASGLVWHLCVSTVVVLGALVQARMLGLIVREHRFDLSLL